MAAEVAILKKHAKLIKAYLRKEHSSDSSLGTMPFAKMVNKYLDKTAEVVKEEKAGTTYYRITTLVPDYFGKILADANAVPASAATASAAVVSGLVPPATPAAPSPTASVAGAAGGGGSLVPPAASAAPSPTTSVAAAAGDGSFVPPVASAAGDLALLSTTPAPGEVTPQHADTPSVPKDVTAPTPPTVHIAASTRKAYKLLVTTGKEKATKGNKADETLMATREMLDDYTKGNSAVKRFFTGHWNRTSSQLRAVASIVKEIDQAKKEKVDAVNVLEKVNRQLGAITLRNASGSLARRLEFMRETLPKCPIMQDAGTDPLVAPTPGS